MERQIDKLHTRVIKQSETIAQLKVESDNIDRLKVTSILSKPYVMCHYVGVLC